MSVQTALNRQDRRLSDAGPPKFRRNSEMQRRRSRERCTPKVTIDATSSISGDVATFPEPEDMETLRNEPSSAP